MSPCWFQDAWEHIRAAVRYHPADWMCPAKFGLPDHVATHCTMTWGIASQTFWNWFMLLWVPLWCMFLSPCQSVTIKREREMLSGWMKQHKYFFFLKCSIHATCSIHPSFSFLVYASWRFVPLTAWPSLCISRWPISLE